jgi:membrane protease YdiL (CAAX protease family)
MASLTVMLVALAALAGLLGRDPADGFWAAVLTGLVGLTVLAAVTGHHASARLGLAFTATVLALALPWQLSWWPLPGAVGVVVYALSHLVPGVRPARHEAVFRLGRLRSVEMWGVVAVVVLSGAILLWFLDAVGPPGLSALADRLTALSPWSLAGIGLAFAVVNAFVEEVLFRGAMLQHLAHALGSWPAVAIQAAAFGLIHFNGYPYGPVGVALAATYGLVLGAMRLRSDGLLAPWVAHVGADIVIFVFIVQSAL